MNKRIIFPAIMFLLVLFTAFLVVISGCSNPTGGGSSGGGGASTTGKVYITDVTNKTVIVLRASGTSLIQVATIELTGATTPQWMALRPDGAKLYVADESANILFVINTATDTVEATVGVCPNPKGMDFNSDGSRLFIVCNPDVAIIDTANNSVSHSVSLPVVITSASDLAYSSSEDAVYIANYGDNLLLKVSAEANGTITGTITVELPYEITMGTGSNAFVTSYGSTTTRLNRVDLTSKTIVQSWESSGSDHGFHGIAITKNKEKLFAADHDTSYIDYLDAKTLPNTLVASNYLAGAAAGISGGPEQIAIYPDGRYLAILNQPGSPATHEVVVVDTVNHERVGALALPSSTYFSIVFKP
jgi:YVTN family beta-propeller protein